MLTSTNARSPWLDLVRGLAALEVCANHVRRLVLVPYESLAHPGRVDTFIYLLSAFAHQAVVIFIVLSGYFVAGSVHQAHLKRTWTWRGYAVQRMSRLWMVLLPCLVLTCLWDALGSWLGQGRGYDGLLRDIMCTGAKNSPPLDHSLLALLGNVFFLDTICVEVFGSNLALWSLANEFWYYVMFPLGFVAVASPAGALQRICCGAALILAFALLPFDITGQAFAVWMLGYVSWLLCRNARVNALLHHPLAVMAAGAGCIASLAALKKGGWIGSDLFLGACLSLLLPRVVTLKAPRGLLLRVSNTLSEMSYSLYLSHLPLLAFLIFGVLKVHHLQPGLQGYSTAAVILVVLLAYAWVIWFCFEKRTPAARSAVSRWFGSRTRPGATPQSVSLSRR
jgi:peptidoglycan/LPS O-acetylase OafA/YrhL